MDRYASTGIAIEQKAMIDQIINELQSAYALMNDAISRASQHELRLMGPVPKPGENRISIEKPEGAMNEALWLARELRFRSENVMQSIAFISEI